MNMTQILLVIHYLILLSVPAATSLTLAYLVAALVGWRSEHRKARLRRFAICLVAVPVLIAISYGFLFGVVLPSMGRDERAKVQAAQQNREEEAGLARVGQLAPIFSATDTDGAVFDLNDKRGKIVVLNFFATWCGPCLKELPLLHELHNKYRESDAVEFVIVGREETAESVANFRKEHHFSFPMVADPERSIYSLYAKSLIPRTYLIDGQGQVVLVLTGFDEDDLKRLEKEIKTRLSREVKR